MMRTLLLLTALVAGCATVPATDSSVLDSAKSRSHEYCAKVKDGCEYRVSAKEKGWTVWIVPIHFGDDGRRVYAIDADDMYFYDRRGRFTGALRGY